MIINALTFELRIFLRKKRSRVEQLKKGIKRKLFFCVPAQEAKSGQPLAPILGQVQINTFDFCTIFNTLSKDYPKGLRLFVELVVKWDKTFEVKLTSFPLSYFIYEYVFLPLKQDPILSKERFLVSIVDFYKLVLIYQQISFSDNLLSCVRSVYTGLRSYKIAVLLCTEEQFSNSLAYLLSKKTKKFLLLEKNSKGYGLQNSHIFHSVSLLKQQFVVSSEQPIIEEI